MEHRAASPSPWTRRFAAAAAVASVPLVLFGGSVTTLGAGMAVEGWLVAEGHFLVLFPIESWFRDVATFVEHSHRLFGVLVGLFALAACASAWLTRAGSLGRTFTTTALVAVCAQGALGGFRVLENSPQLAFLHGGCAQAVFALLAVSAVALRPRRSTARGDRSLPVGLAALASMVVLGQVLLGAWYRHGLRPLPGADSNERLGLHLVGALAAFAAVGALGSALRRSDDPALERAGRRLHALLGVQVVLGVIAWIGFAPGAVAPLEWISSITHVLCGALLLAQCAVAWLVCARARGAESFHASEVTA